MTPTIDQLLDEPMLDFTPRTGTFDVEAIAAKIAGIGFPYRDEIDPSRFAIFSDAAARDACRDERHADPTSAFPFVLQVTVTPPAVVVFPESEQLDLRALSTEFLEYMTATYDCRIANEFGTDMSDPAAYPAETPD